MANIYLYKTILEHFRKLSPFSRFSHFKICDIKNVGQGHDGLHSQCRHSMINTWLAIVIFAFFQRLIIKIVTLKVWPWKLKLRSRSWSTTFAIVPFDENINLYESRTIAFSASFHRFRDTHISNSWPWKYMSRSWRTFAVAPFDGKYPTFYLKAIVTFALSLTVYEMFEIQENCKDFDL